MAQQVGAAGTSPASAWTRAVIASSVPVPAVAGFTAERLELTRIEHRCDDGAWLLRLAGATAQRVVEVTVDSRRLSCVPLRRQKDGRWELRPGLAGRRTDGHLPGGGRAQSHALPELTDARARLTIRYADGVSEVLALFGHPGGTTCWHRGAADVQPRRQRPVAVVRPLDAVAG